MSCARQVPFVFRSRLRPGVALGMFAVVAGVMQAAPFAGPKVDHALCCPRGYNPLQHDGGEDPLLNVMPGLEFGGDSGMARVERRAPAAVKGAPSDAGRNAGPAVPPPPAVLTGPPLATLEGPLETIGGYASIHYSQLAGFKFRPPPQPVAAGQPPPEVLTQVPPAIRRLDGRKVVLTGYMLPLKLENGLATEFFFLSSPTLCCYGVVPEVNEWMHVKMRGEGLPAIQDVPMFLAGRLHVRARWEEGYLTGIYELEGHGLLKPRK